MNATAPTTRPARHPVPKALTQRVLLRATRAIMPVHLLGGEHLAPLTGPVVYVANHQSHLDIFSILNGLGPKRRRQLVVAAAADYFFANRVKGALVSLAFGAVPLPRAGGSRDALDGLKARVRAGWSLLIFPEGTRRTGERLPGEPLGFRKGFAYIALDCGAPVVPLYVHGVRDLMPKGSVVPIPGSVLVAAGPAIAPADHDYDTLAAAADAAVCALETHTIELLGGWGHSPDEEE